MQSHTDIHTHPHTYTPMQWSDSVICSVGEGSDITWWPRVPVLLMISNDHYTQKQSWPRLTLSYSRSHPVKETWTLLSQDINGYSCFITHSPIHSVSKNGGSTHVYLFLLPSSSLVDLRFWIIFFLLFYFPWRVHYQLACFFRNCFLRVY